MQEHHPHQWAPFQVAGLAAHMAYLTLDLHTSLSQGSTVVKMPMRNIFIIATIAGNAPHYSGLKF